MLDALRLLTACVTHSTKVVGVIRAALVLMNALMSAKHNSTGEKSGEWVGRNW